MTLDELLAKTPEPWRPIVTRYGPILLEWSTAEIWAWIEDIVKGRSAEAWQKVMGNLDNAALLTEGEALVTDWDTANAANKARMTMMRTAMMAVLQVLLGVALALVGL